MRLAEETVLLLLNEESGYLEHVGGWNLACAIAGSVIADLSLELRIDTDLESLRLLDSNKTGDVILDPVLEKIAEDSDSVHNAQYWIEKTADRTDWVVETVLNRLVENNILDHDSGGFWSLNRSVSRTGMYPPTGGLKLEETKSRIFSVILDGEIPDPRDVLLISLVAACDAFRLMFSEEDYALAKERIDLVCGIDLVGQAIRSAIEASRTRPARAFVSHSKPIPKASLTWVLRNRHVWRGDFSRLLTDMYKEYGPVFRLAGPFSNNGVVVLAGCDTNKWINQNGRYYFRSRDHMHDFEKLYGASRTIPGMDGAEHFRMRKALRSGYSRKLLENRIGEVYQYCRESFKDWQGVDTADVIDDILKYEHRSLVTHVQGALPKFMMWTPAMRKKRRVIFNLIEKVYAAHTPAQRKDKPRDLIDSVLDLHAADPQFFPETDMSFLFVAGLIASIYLGSALGFAVYGMAASPEILRRVQEEADRLFASGDPDTSALNSIDVAHRVYVESQRMYPVIPLQLRTVMNHLVIHGFDVPKDTLVVFGHTATHHIEEWFPNPGLFDIDRYTSPRDEHKNTGAYVPFGLGTHRCLGARLVELQMAVNLLLIAHHFDISISPANFDMTFNPFPTAAPTKKLKFRIDQCRRKI